VLHELTIHIDTDISVDRSTVIMGVNHGGREGASPPEFGVGDANANCPPNLVMFQNFKHQITCITMQLKVYEPWMTLTQYSLFPKNTSSSSTK